MSYFIVTYDIVEESNYTTQSGNQLLPHPNGEGVGLGLPAAKAQYIPVTRMGLMPTQDADERRANIYNEIKKFKPTKLSESCYLFKSEESLDQLSQYLVGKVGTDDVLYIIQVSLNSIRPTISI